MDFTLPQPVTELMNLFKNKGFEIYIVGGAVRDILMNREVTDWDFTTNAKPEEMLAFLPEDAYYTNAFGTVGIPKETGNPFEITTYRTEHGYSDNRRPDTVSWGKTLQEDLERRDFTINALAINTKKEVIDLYNGKNDIEKKIIQTVGEPSDRFSEDALRMMRAIRIATELEFTIEDKTFEAIKTNAKLIEKISRERVRDELLKILSSKTPELGITLLRESGILALIIPELEKTFGVEQKSPGRHHIYDVWTHSINALTAVSERNTDPIVRLATLIHDIGKPQTFRKLETGTITFYNHEVVGAAIAKRIAERLRFSNEQKEKLWRLVRFHQFTVNEHQTDSALRRFIVNVTPELLNDMIDLRIGDRIGSGSTETSWRTEEFKKRLIEVQKQPFAVKDLKISGNDVMEVLGISPSPKVGEILNNLFNQVVEEGLPNERDVLLERVSQLSWFLIPLHMYKTVVGTICLGNKILFFQRDDIPSIPDPGKWQIPGGHSEEDETPDMAIKRELIEEVGYCPSHITYVGSRKTDLVETFVYWSYISEEEANRFSLGKDEGQAIRFMTIEEALKLDLTKPVRFYLENFKEVINNHLKNQSIPHESDFEV